MGGTKGYDDWYPRPRAKMTRDILERTFKMCPELAPPEIRAEREPTIEDVLPLIIEEGCGLRPGRIGGIRLDVEWRIAGEGDVSIPIVFNYGCVSLPCAFLDQSDNLSFKGTEDMDSNHPGALQTSPAHFSRKHLKANSERINTRNGLLSQ